MPDFEWEVVTPSRVWRRSRDKIALSQLLKELEAKGSELWGFTVWWDGHALFSWDTRTGLYWLAQGDGTLSQHQGESQGQPFCYLLRTAGPKEIKDILELGVEPWIKIQYNPATRSLEVKHEQP